MGGRGASSGAGGRKYSGTNAQGQARVFYDRTNQFAGMSMHEFENAIRSRDHEFIGGFDSSGKLVVAGTSASKGSVIVPTGHPEFSRITTLTHNHPSDSTRPLGGTLSEADVKILGRYGNLKSMRAVASGKGEHSYIMQQSSGKTANHAGLMTAAIAAERNGQLAKMGHTAVAKVQKGLGRPLTQAETNRAYIGGMKNAWNTIAKQNGFDYVRLKKAPW